MVSGSSSRSGLELGYAIIVGALDRDDPPQPLVVLRRHLAAWREDADLVASADRAARQLDRLGHVALEVEAEGAAVGERVDLAAQVGGERLVLLADLPNQVVDAGHRISFYSSVADSNRAARERGEDALVGLARQVPVAGLAERCARPGGRLAGAAGPARAATT